MYKALKFLRLSVIKKLSDINNFIINIILLYKIIYIIFLGYEPTSLYLADLYFNEGKILIYIIYSIIIILFQAQSLLYIIIIIIIKFIYIYIKINILN